MEISVVVPTRNRQATLQRTIAALMAQQYRDYEVIVVDDASTDNTEEVVRRHFPGVRFVRLELNRGPAAARNVGIRAARGEVVALTDDDCVAPREWLTQLAAGYARHPEVGGVGGYMEAPPHALGKNVIAHYESYVSHMRYGAGDREYIGGFECPAGGTNNMSYRKAVLDAVGGFDETFPYPAGEDTDLKLRVCQLGERLLYVPLRVVHLRSYTWGALRRQQVVRGRGAIHFERKHGRLPSRHRVALRAAKRGLRFWQDVPHTGLPLAWVKLWAGWFECWGQWLELQRLRGRDHTPGK